MPTIVVGDKELNGEEGKKLVLVLEDHGIDIMHMCGGHAQCGTCRVEVLGGSVEPMSPLELRTLQTKGVATDGHIRLSCQLRVKEDIVVQPLLTVHEMGVGPGPRPRD